MSQGISNKYFPIKLCSNTEEEAKYLEIGSTRYLEYIKNLALIPQQTNAPNICIGCWCFMSNSQMKAHKEDHKILKRTPAQYATEANFKTLAKEKSHSRMLADKTEEIKVLFAKPLASHQNKIAISSSASLPNNVVESGVSKKLTEELKVDQVKIEDYGEADEEEDILLDAFLRRNKEKIMKPDHLLRQVVEYKPADLKTKAVDLNEKSQKSEARSIQDENILNSLMSKLDIIQKGQENLTNEFEDLKQENQVFK